MMRFRMIPARLLILILLFVTAVPLTAQQPAEGKEQSADQLAGKKLFVQRCSLCHLPQEPEPREAYGPPLERLFARGSTSEAEARVREIIRRGGARGMPGFQYGLEPSEINQLIAYLKTLSR